MLPYSSIRTCNLNIVHQTLLSEFARQERVDYNLNCKLIWLNRRTVLHLLSKYCLYSQFAATLSAVAVYEN